MVTRVTLDEFFAALKGDGRAPFIDNTEVRDHLHRNLAHIGRNYRVKDRWPVIDVEYAYERYLNSSSDLPRLRAEQGYRGTVRLDSFDETYSLDEWFDDFRIEYSLRDTLDIRKHMMRLLPPQKTWLPYLLCCVYIEVSKPRLEVLGHLLGVHRLL